MPLLPSKPPKKREPPVVHGYKPPEDHEDWFSEKESAGWKTSQILTEVVATFMLLERELAPLEKDIEAFARAEGLLKDGDAPEKSRAWVRETMVRWMKRGHESWKREQGTKSGK